MKLESEGDTSLCLFISAERRSEAAAADGDGAPSAQASAASIGSDATGRDGDGGCGAQSLWQAPAADGLPNCPTKAEPQGLGSLSCEHFRFIDEDEDADEPPPRDESPRLQNGHRHLPGEPEEQGEVSASSPDSSGMGDCAASRKELRSVLKKGLGSDRKSKKARVTFDEAVTLYSDEFDEVQMLALRSGPEVNCAEVFYMFEPPIEYQDLMLPFEPPAEYRDPDTAAEESIQCSSPPDNQPCSVAVEPPDVSNSIAQEEPRVQEVEVEKEPEPEQIIDSNAAESTDGGDSKEDINKEPVVESSETDHQQSQVNPAEESEKLFERFLEAEREFDEDEELNRVFHVLENDLDTDDKNGTFDDNFFKKLINLLSSVEGDAPVQEADFFTTTDFTVGEEELAKEAEDDEQAHSRTLSEADSDCSVSSQDTIIVRLGDEEPDTPKRKLCRQNSESEPQAECVESKTEEAQAALSALVSENYDDVFNEMSNAHPLSNNGEEALCKAQCIRVPTTKPEAVNNANGSGDLSRQSSGEQAAKDTIQDADDSTSSDSRSGEVEEDIKLDDIGYDEEDADDYDEECLRGMVRGNSKIRRIIKKNALQCPLFRGIEARRRQQSGSKYPRPKSPPLSQESLVEQLKWLTTVDDKEVDNFPGSKPPDVILSTVGVARKGMQQCNSSEDEFSGGHYRYPDHYPRHMVGQDSKAPTYHMQSGNYPVSHMARPVRPWPPNNAQVPQQLHRPAYPAPRAIVRPMPSQMSYSDERMAAVSPVPRDCRDWRVIQRVPMNRSDSGYGPPPDFARCPNGTINTYRRVLPTQGHDELEQFVQQGSQRIERIRKRYSVAEEDDDPTFGFARRPSVRSLQNRLPPSGLQYQPSDASQPPDVGVQYVPAYASVDSAVPAGGAVRPRNPADMAWGRTPNWRPGDPAIVYSASGPNRPSGPVPVHRASVALTELSGCATLPHTKTHTDPRYHSYAENIYSGSQTLPHKRWNSVDPRTCIVSGTSTIPRQVPPHQLARLPGPQPTLQVPVGVSSDERGVPEGASSSPKVSSDSLYHGPLPEALPVGAAHKDDGVIYYSMNV